MVSKNNIKNIRLFSILILLVSLILTGRLYFLQIVYGDSYKQKADRQYQRPNDNLYDRGSIFFEDKDGAVGSAAALKSGFTVAINPQKIVNAEEVYKKINEIIPIDKELFLAKASKKNDLYEEISKRVDSDLGKKIASLKMPGVSIYEDRWRFYPGNRLASQVLGFVGYNNKSVYTGQYGLERQYDDVLNRSGGSLYNNFFAEIFGGAQKIANGDSFEGDIITTIEPNVQRTLEETLRKIVDAYKSKVTGGIVINPTNGEIYAMAAVPDFDPNTFQNETDHSVFVDPNVESSFEMGSVFKPITIASGIDAGVVTAESQYFDPGYAMLNGKTFWDFDHKAKGMQNLQDVLSHSLNTGAAFVEGKLGNEIFKKYLLSFGIGEETGIDLPNETNGQISNLNSPRDLEYAQAAFGQGIAVSPIMMTRAVSAIANGGILVTPHIVKQINYKVGVSKVITYEDSKRIIKKESADEVTRMLINAVDTALLNGQSKIVNYSIAAKTGTAQVAKEGGGGYYEDKFLHSFVGYFPAYNPKFLIFLYTKEPQGVDFAQNTLGKPFFDLTKFLINYYEIPPDR